MMRKGLLLKYLKKKALPGIVEKSWKIERMVVKVIGKGASKDPRTNGSVQNLQIVSFMRKGNEKKKKKGSMTGMLREEKREV